MMKSLWPILRDYTMMTAGAHAFVVIGEANEVISEGFRPHLPLK